SSLMSLNSSSLPSRYTGSRTGRTSTSEPGRNARTSLMSTVKPPLTLPLMRPTMVSFFSSASSSSSHTMARLAFSRDSTVSPKPFSSESRATLTISPSATSISPASLRNCSIGTMPSDLRPALMTTTSVRTWTTVPVTMAPGLSLARCDWLASNSSANDSVIWTNTRLMTQTACRMKAWRSTRLSACAGLRGAVSVVVDVTARDIPCGACLPARPDKDAGSPATAKCGLGGDQRQHAPDDLVDAKACGVDVDGIGCRPQRRHRAAGVTGVAREDLAQQTGHCDRNPLVLQLFIAPFRALGRAGGQEHLERRVREDDRAHVTAVRHQPRRLPECALAVREGGADRGDGGNGRSRCPRRPGAQFVGGVMAVDQHAQLAICGLDEVDPGIGGAADQRLRVCQVDTGPARGHPDGPVQRARIEVVPAQSPRHEAADRALAGAGRTIDGEDWNGIWHGLRS